MQPGIQGMLSLSVIFFGTQTHSGFLASVLVLLLSVSETLPFSSLQGTAVGKWGCGGNTRSLMFQAPAYTPARRCRQCGSSGGPRQTPSSRLTRGRQKVPRRLELGLFGIAVVSETQSWPFALFPPVNGIFLFFFCALPFSRSLWERQSGCELHFFVCMRHCVRRPGGAGRGLGFSLLSSLYTDRSTIMLAPVVISGC